MDIWLSSRVSVDKRGVIRSVWTDRRLGGGAFGMSMDLRGGASGLSRDKWRGWHLECP
jgi:hypothetical protein